MTDVLVAKLVALLTEYDLVDELADLRIRARQVASSSMPLVSSGRVIDSSGSVRVHDRTFGTFLAA